MSKDETFAYHVLRAQLIHNKTKAQLQAAREGLSNIIQEISAPIMQGDNAAKRAKRIERMARIALGSSIEDEGNANVTAG